MNFYHVTKEVSQLYSKLQDNLSQEVFWARLQYDIYPSATGMLRLWELTGIPGLEELKQQRNWKEHLQSLMHAGNQIFLYGAGLRGTQVATDLLHDGGDFTGFVDRNYQNLPSEIMGKPIYSPNHLFENMDSSYLIITTVEFEKDIAAFLMENKFPQEHILSYFTKRDIRRHSSTTKQYFEFPELFPKGTAFIDGGSYDGQDSLRFANWCNGAYSKILVFEPDPENIKKCKANLRPLRDVEVFHAGLSDKTERSSFSAVGKGHSRLAELEGKTGIEDTLFTNAALTEIQTFALDEVVKDCKVGLIKMDIEGAEMKALAGARAVIRRDKPLLAICVYHKPGDVLAIMDYLSDTVPEYRFWLRHYELYANETVLYAAI